MAPHSSTLAWKIHGQWSLVGRSPWGHKESDTTERLPFHFSLSCIGEGNSNPLQCSCLENPRDGKAWWAAIYGVTQSWTRLSDLAIAIAERTETSVEESVSYLGVGLGSALTENWRERNSGLLLRASCTGKSLDYSQRVFSSFPEGLGGQLHNRQMVLSCA